MLPVSSPILCTMLSKCDTPLDSASHGLVEVAKRARADMERGDAATHDELMSRILYPGLKKALRSPRELVRHEFLGILDELVIFWALLARV